MQKTHFVLMAAAIIAAAALPAQAALITQTFDDQGFVGQTGTFASNLIDGISVTMHKSGDVFGASEDPTYVEGDQGVDPDVVTRNEYGVLAGQADEFNVLRVEFVQPVSLVAAWIGDSDDTMAKQVTMTAYDENMDVVDVPLALSTHQSLPSLVLADRQVPLQQQLDVAIKYVVFSSPDGEVTIDNLMYEPSAIPEPATISLVAIAGLAVLRRRR